jgi:hypothetical protein
MRKFLLAAAVAAIALVGLTANQCGGGDTAQSPAPAAPAPEPEKAPPTEPPPAQQ